MSKLLKIFLVILTIAACSKKIDKDTLTITTSEGNVITYQVELAQTPKELSKGLMNRESLDANAGMIFDLSTIEDQVSMWMKDTLIPLDMLFIDKEGKIFWIYENAEPNSTRRIVPPHQPFAVLEINGGDVAKHNIQTGDTVAHRIFPELAVITYTPPVNVEVTEVVETEAPLN